jgi:hypothetical protein
VGDYISITDEFLGLRFTINEQVDHDERLVGRIRDALHNEWRSKLPRTSIMSYSYSETNQRFSIVFQIYMTDEKETVPVIQSMLKAVVAIHKKGGKPAIQARPATPVEQPQTRVSAMRKKFRSRK